MPQIQNQKLTANHQLAWRLLFVFAFLLAPLTTNAFTSLTTNAAHFQNPKMAVSGNLTWASAEVGGYGALPGATAPRLGSQSSLLAATIWRGHYLDATGFYHLGARVYDPQSGRFLSPDPLGHASSLSLYDYANGDPVNGLDPDGRFGKNTLDMSSLSPELQNFTENYNSGMSDYDAQVLENGGPATVGQIFTYGVSLVANIAISPLMSVSADIGKLAYGVDMMNDNAPVSGWDRLGAGASLALDFLPVIDEAKLGTTALRGGMEGLEAADAGVNAGVTLPEREIGNFIGQPQQVTINEGETLYGIRDTGSRNVWWTRTQPIGELQWRMDQAVLPEWNEATQIETLTVPKGQSIMGFEGVARGQGSYLGGGNQVYIPNVPSGWSNVEPW